MLSSFSKFVSYSFVEFSLNCTNKFHANLPKFNTACWPYHIVAMSTIQSPTQSNQNLTNIAHLLGVKDKTKSTGKTLILTKVTKGLR